MFSGGARGRGDGGDRGGGSRSKPRDDVLRSSSRAANSLLGKKRPGPTRVAANELKKTNEGGAKVKDVIGNEGISVEALDVAGSAADLSEEEAILDDTVVYGNAKTVGSSSSYKPIDAVATPKPIGPHEWVAMKTRMAEMIALDKSKVFTNPPKASIGRRNYDFYLLVVSTPYWLDQIKERVGQKKVACRQVWSSRCVCAWSIEFMGMVCSLQLISTRPGA